MIWIKIRGEIKEQKSNRKSIAKKDKSEIKSKIRLKFDSKLKYDVIGREITRKTQIVTRDNTGIDPIDRRIRGFSFREFEDDRRHSRSDVPLFSQQTLLGCVNESRSEGNQEIQGLRCLNSSITRNTLEIFTLSKNMSIYKQNLAWPLDLTLHLQLKAHMKRLDMNHCH